MTLIDMNARMSRKGVITLIGIIGVSLLGIGLYEDGGFTSSVTTSINPQIPTTVPTPQFEGYRAFSIDMYNLLDQTDKQFSDNNFRAVIMQSDDGKHFRPVSYVPFYPNATTIDITKEMSDKLYLEIYPFNWGNFADVEYNKLHQYYILPTQVSNDNSGLLEWDSMDANNVGTRDWIFKLHPEQLVPDMNYGSTNIPEKIFQIKPIRFQNPMNFTLGNVTSMQVETPSDTRYILPTLLKLKPNSGIALSEVLFKITTSRTNLFNENKSAIMLPHVGLLMLKDLTKYNDTKNPKDVYYRYDFTAPISSKFGLNDGQRVIGLKGSDYLIQGTNNDTYKIELTLDTNFKDLSKDTITVTERIYYFDPWQAMNSYNIQPLQLGVGSQ